jgi:hypothetical protein
MLIKRNVKVKIIMTTKTRNDFEKEFLGEIQQIRMELEQLEFQSKKLIVEAKRKNLDSKQMHIKIKHEQDKRLARLEQMEIRVKEILKVPDGAELGYSTVDSFVEVKIGDRWDSLVESTEIILKDGIVVEIREQ